MKKILLFVFLLLAGKAAYAQAADTVFVHETQIPVLIERQDNVLFKMRIEAGAGKRLDEVILNFGKEVKLSDIRSVKLYY
uniref:BNR-repeat neuraminidase N-terminal domain-containing protein n=1 Tax=Prevotella heparinolytica TaxID=28113 RepID=UPI0035A1CCF8